MTEPRFPVARIRPILLRWAKRYANHDAIEDLAHRSGVPFRVVRGVFRGHLADDLSLDVTDALLVAADSVEAFRTELWDLYVVGLDVAALEHSRQSKRIDEREAA